MANKTKIGLVLLALVVLSVFAVAGVVVYLSNTVTADINVESPMTMTIDGGVVPVSFDAYAGEEVTFTTVGTNVANKAVSVYPTIFTLVAPDGNVWTGNEFTSINVIDRSVDKGDVLPVLFIVNNNGTKGEQFISMSAPSTTNVIRVMVDENQLTTTFDKYDHPAGSAIDNVITVDLADNLTPGTYSLVAQHLFNLVK